MPNASRIIDRLRAENMVLRAMVAELGGRPPAAFVSHVVEVRVESPSLPMLKHLAQRGL